MAKKPKKDPLKDLLRKLDEGGVRPTGGSRSLGSRASNLDLSGFFDELNLENDPEGRILRDVGMSPKELQRKRLALERSLEGKTAKNRAKIQKAIDKIDSQIQRVMGRPQPLPSKAGMVIPGGATGNLQATPDELKVLRTEVDERLAEEIMAKAEAERIPAPSPFDDVDLGSGGFRSPKSGGNPLDDFAEPAYNLEGSPHVGPPRPTQADRKSMREAAAAKAKASAERAAAVEPKMAEWGKKKGLVTNLRVKARKAMGPDMRAVWKQGSWMNPMSLKGGLLAGALPFAMDFVKNTVTGTKEMFGVGSQMFDGMSAVDEMLQQQNAVNTVNRIQQKRQQRLEMLRAQNRMRLMQTSPHLAQSLLAGMELPMDGVVIGGRPRTDLLDQVADQMGAGMFAAPDEME
jgi:hypothetical protein